jgi:hypothetical protein
MDVFVPKERMLNMTRTQSSTFSHILWPPKTDKLEELPLQCLGVDTQVLLMH